MAQSLTEYMEQTSSYGLTLEDISTNSLRTLVERYSEQNCCYLNVPDDKVICRILGKYLMWVDAHDQGLSPHLIFQGYWEMWITAAIARSVRPGTTTIDIGANVGYYTVLLADAVGEGGQVIAFEPNSRLRAMLNATVNLNGYGSRVMIRPEAITTPDIASLIFAIPQQEPKNAGIVKNDAEKLSFEQQFGNALTFVEVPTIALDAIGLSNLGVVKIDAEGAEYDIWLGMQETIANNPDIQIFMEFNASRGYGVTTFLDQITELFRLRHIDFDGEIKALTREMIANERKGDDWMLYLSRM